MLRILALGDSYTIGEAVEVHERWSMQLAAMLRAEGTGVSDPLIVARTGWTTDELSSAIDETNPTGPFDIVTLLIGVNNQYRGRALDEYREQFRALLVRAVAFAGGDAAHVVVLSIPDWGLTPFADGRDRRQIASEIDAFNASNREETLRAGAHYVDITVVSRQKPELVASDGLHPSGAMYEEWARLAMPTVRRVLRR